MKKVLWAVLTLLLACALESGCRSRRDGDEKQHVVVIHSWSDEGEEGEPFRREMEKAFRDKDIRAEIHHIYLNMVERSVDSVNEKDFPPYADSISRWKPRVILVNDDNALEWILDGYFPLIFRKHPIVFAGVNVVDQEKLERFPNITGWEDKIDYARNAELINYVTQSPIATIQLDSTEYDLKLREQIFEAIKDTTRFINNWDFHQTPLNKAYLDSVYPGVISVSMVSAANPWVNGPEGQHYKPHALNITASFYRNAKFLYYLNVKKDIWSRTLIRLSRRPQFTAIREDFNNPDDPILWCGYFTSMRTQVRDQVEYAARILGGTRVQDLPIGLHEKGYYMDYNALKIMKKLPVDLQEQSSISIGDYDEYKKLFTVINLPFRVRQPILFLAMRATGIFLTTLLIVVVILFFYRRQSRAVESYMKEMENEAFLRQRILSDSDSSVWSAQKMTIAFSNEVEKIYGIPRHISVADVHPYIHEEDREKFSRLLNYYNEIGRRKVRLRIRFPKHNHYHWYDVIYNITPEAATTHTLSGLLINVDEEVNTTQELTRALAQAQEVELKAKFLENISQNLQEPLIEVLDNAGMIADEKAAYTPQQIHTFSTRISDGIKSLLNMIDSVVHITSRADGSGKTGMLILLLALGTALTGCTPERKPIRVFSVHRFDPDMEGYRDYHEILTNTFRIKGYEPEYRDLYLDVDDPNLYDGHTYAWGPKPQAMADSMRAQNWKPDIVLAECDEAVRRLNAPYLHDIFSFIDSVPCIYGGVIFPDWEALPRRSNVTIISDPMDIGKNVDLCYDLMQRAPDITPSSIEVVELDYSEYDKKIRAQLSEELRRSSYVDNSDWHENSLTETDFATLWKDSIMVLVVSAMHPERNGQKEMGLKEGVKDIEELNRQSWNFPHLMLKKDVWAEFLSCKTSVPQFTARREYFNTESHNFLAGYFASYQTVARDMAEAAVDQLQGKRNITAVRNHTKNYYMDYLAMKKMGLRYKDLKDQYVIVNVPDKVANPTRYWIRKVLNILTYILVVTLTVGFFIHRSRRKVRRMERRLTNERTLNEIALRGAQNHYIGSMDEIYAILNRMKDDDHQLKQEIMHSLYEPGSYRFRIQAALEVDRTMEWWQLRYAVDQDINGNTRIEGLVINITDSIRNEEKLTRARILEEEAREKENFLWKIAHEIRTPMNSIMGFADLLDVMGQDVSPDERREMCLAIMDSSDALQKIITDIMQYAHIENRTVTFEQQEIHIDRLMKDLYEENREWVERKGLTLYLQKGRKDVVMRADEEKLREAMQQLIDNARKFTARGKVVMGWEYILNQNEVVLFVEDSGEGLAADRLEGLFSRFWKADSFVPGLGIGLNITQNYVGGMGGTIDVETEEGVGSRFFLKFKTVKP